MATAQTASGHGVPPAAAAARNSDRRYISNQPPMPSQPSPRTSPLIKASVDDARGSKRRMDVDDDPRREEYSSHYEYPSPPYRHDALPRSEKTSFSGSNRLGPTPTGGSTYHRNGSGGPAYSSPRTQLPSFNSLSSSTSVDDPAMKKRRAGPAPGDGYSEGVPRSGNFASYAREAPPSTEDEQRYRGFGRAGHSHNGQPSPSYDDRGYGAAPPGARGLLHSPIPPSPEDEHHHRMHSADEALDSSIPLARRRGDAAQAKASKLHIDTGSAASDRGFDARLPPTHLPALAPHPRSGSDSALVARSAPPTKVSFSERDGPMTHDPRGESMRGKGPAGSGYAPYLSPHASQSYSRQGPGRGYGDHLGPPSRSPPGPSLLHHQTNASSSEHRDPAHLSRPGPPLPPPAGIAGAQTPVTARFVPQTATLPSPAYHTRLARDVNGPSNGPSGLGQVPRTAGLPPPQTARLPDHLRSPPSSKTQFLSLFSNFYDSLGDSRTLKATLEDQVRRSNALLQTLQKSSKVLEATVDRKIREERSMWESRVLELEGRVRELERERGIEPASTARSDMDEDAEVKQGDAAREATEQEEDYRPIRGRATDSEEHGQRSREASRSRGPAASSSPPKHREDSAGADEEDELDDRK